MHLRPRRRVDGEYCKRLRLKKELSAIAKDRIQWGRPFQKSKKKHICNDHCEFNSHIIETKWD